MKDKKPIVNDQNLRNERLVFYRRHIDQVDRVLTEFLKKAGARSCFLIDKDGHLITRAGEPCEFDADTISALVAGAFAATKQMAALLGEQEFSCLFHQGTHDNIQLSLVGQRAILTVLFDDSTTLGMVRLYVSEAVRRLADIFEQSANGRGASDEEVDPSYGDSARRTLEDLFADKKKD